ncbi:unnamed protein product [Sympodiomycopsis kandeliae]
MESASTTVASSWDPASSKSPSGVSSAVASSSTIGSSSALAISSTVGSSSAVASSSTIGSSSALAISSTVGSSSLQAKRPRPTISVPLYDLLVDGTFNMVLGNKAGRTSKTIRIAQGKDMRVSLVPPPGLDTENSLFVRADLEAPAFLARRSADEQWAECPTRTEAVIDLLQRIAACKGVQLAEVTSKGRSVVSARTKAILSQDGLELNKQGVSLGGEH